eukprot:m.62774 g.62774  ORF g.62774 m.62774 type:complete len:254 (-) comp7419_c0_seq3:153-914(-)
MLSHSLRSTALLSPLLRHPRRWVLLQVLVLAMHSSFYVGEHSVEESPAFSQSQENHTLHDVSVWSLGCPPVPVLNEFAGLWTFLGENVDDFAEDVTKLACLGVSALPAASGPAGALVSGVAAAYSYESCNALADRVGDAVGRVVSKVTLALGLPPARQLHAVPLEDSTSRLVRLADDAVEDSFKIACLWLWHGVGKLLNQNFLLRIPSLQGSVWASLLGNMISVSIPARYYKACDAYGDQLGDLAQSWAAQFG